MAFRFFINVDQCLNMNNFDFFFYQKRYRNEFHVTEDVYIGEGTGLSFAEAAADIRLFLDKYPYIVTDYQIIIAMRSDIDYNVTVWRDTLLSRLLDIDFALRQSNIVIRSGGRNEVAVNLIMLYEANIVKSLNSHDDYYMSDNRLGYDCKLLLKEIGVPEEKENDLECLKNCWEQYLIEHKAEFESSGRLADGTYNHPLFIFFNNLLKQYESDQNDENASRRHVVSTLQALKEVLDGYQVFELVTEKQKRDVDINALLRIVEFATTDFKKTGGVSVNVSLSELCKQHWKSVVSMKDDQIRERYSKMLYLYKNKLQDYANRESAGTGVGTVEAILPDSIIPNDKEISVNSDMFEGEQTQQDAKNDPKKQLEEFKHGLALNGKLMEKWETTYKSLRDSISELDEKLKKYAADLGEVYNQELKKRKEIEESWNNNVYLENETTKSEVDWLVSEERKLLRKMDQPQMTPTLQFQDQLNMEAALDQENLNITHYISCIQSVTAKGFLLLLLFIIGIITFHYIVLQPYNLSSSDSGLCVLMYLLFTSVLMFFTWISPIRHYKQKIIQCLSHLDTKMDKYITGFFDRAKQFHEYINLINRLDYIERHLRLKRKAVKTTQWIISARAWHINQAKAHLEKLGFFDGLISTYHPDMDKTESNDNELMDSIPEITKDHVDDVFQSKLYWPQQL